MISRIISRTPNLRLRIRIVNLLTAWAEAEGETAAFFAEKAIYGYSCEQEGRMLPMSRFNMAFTLRSARKWERASREGWTRP